MCYGLWDTRTFVVGIQLNMSIESICVCMTVHTNVFWHMLFFCAKIYNSGELIKLHSLLTFN